jgi:hypothetical protein
LLPDCPISSLARNPRTLLGLEAAWARGADVVVFSTVGCDPAGVRAVYDAVAARLHRGAAIQLSYLFLQSRTMRRDCFPGSVCVEVTRNPARPRR